MKPDADEKRKRGAVGIEVWLLAAVRAAYRAAVRPGSGPELSTSSASRTSTGAEAIGELWGHSRLGPSMNS